MQDAGRPLIACLQRLTGVTGLAKDSDVFSHIQPPIVPLHVLASFKLAKVANHLVGMVNDCFDDPPPPEKTFSGYTDDVTTELIFSPNQPINHLEARMHLWVGENFTTHRIGVLHLPE